MTTHTDFNPLLEWEMRTLARKGRYYVLQTAYVAMLLAVLYWTYEQIPGKGQFSQFSVHESMRFVAWFSNRFFVSASILQILAILLITPVFAGAAIVGDVERRTLDDLLTTGLTDWDIVVAKWATRTLNVLQLVIASAPLFGLMILLGGVGIEQVVFVAITSCATAASTAAISICDSVGATRTRQAVGAAYLGVFVWQLVPFVVSAFYVPAIFGAADKPFLWDLFLVLCPVWMILECSGSVSISGSLGERVTWFVIVHLALAASQLSHAAAALRAERKCIAMAELRERAKKELQLVRELPPPGNWPIFWKEWNFGFQWPIVAVGLFCLFIYSQFLFSIGQLQNGNHSGFVHVANSAIAAAYLTIALRLAPCMTAERERACWIPLLTTPLSGRQIVIEKLLGSLRPLRALTLILLPYLVIGPVIGALTLISAVSLVGVVAAHVLLIAGIAINASMRSATSTIAYVWTLATCFTLGGGGAWIALELGCDPHDFGIGTALVASIPWLEIAAVQRNALGRLSISPMGLPAIYWSYWFIAGYAAMGASLLVFAIVTFDRCAGRISNRSQ